MQKYNQNNSKNLDVSWPFPQEKSEKAIKEKQYLLKLSSNDADNGSPFDFQVKFAMEKIDISSNNHKTYKKEALVQSKYQNIACLEVSDVVLPRFIPSNIMGNVFDGFTLVKNTALSGSGIRYLLSTLPGYNLQLNQVDVSGTLVDYLKLTNYKDTIVLIKYNATQNYSNFILDSSIKESNIYDHIVIDKYLVPIYEIENTRIRLNPSININITLPNELQLIINQPNVLFNQMNNNDITISSSSIIIPHMPIESTYQILKNTSIRIFDCSGHNYYYNVSSVSTDISNITTIKGSEYSGTNINLFSSASGCDLYLYSVGTRDLLDERVFYLEIDPFTPVKATSTNIDTDKMFGMLFPSTQSKNWIYLSGEPKEMFLPTDYRKLDRITIRIYDSNGNSLNEVFSNNKNILTKLYKNKLFTSMVLKIDEVEKTLIKY
jgi:hypothetical protein